MRLFFLSLFISTVSIAQTYNAYSLEEAISNKKTVTSITFSNLKEFKLSIELTEMPNLEELVFSGVSLKTLPEFISEIKSLKRIDLSNNPEMDINQVCKVIGELNLTSVSFEDCKLPFLPFQIGYIKSLKHLNVSNNYIKKLPATLVNLDNLEDLNMAMNYLDSIHCPINSLPKLKVLDLSFNKNVVLDHLITSSIDFPSLNEIKVVGVKHFPSTLNKRTGKLDKLDLSMTDFEDINQLTVDSFQVDHVIANDCEKLNYNFLCKSLERSGVKKLEIADKNMANLPKGIHRMKLLEELTVGHSSINYVPSLNNHKKLKRITVNSRELKTIYNSVKSLPNLEYLDIKKTEVNAKEVVKLIDQFPHAEIVYNPQKIGTPIRFPDFLKNIAFKAPFENLMKPFEKFKFDSRSQREIELFSGTKVSMPSNSFQTKNNKPYNGGVVFEIKEIKTSLEIFASGLPMVYDSSAVFGFESGGMYIMNAKTINGEELFLRDNKLINIKTELPDDNGGFQTYRLNDEIKWENSGTVVNDKIGNWRMNFGDLDFNQMRSNKPKLNHDQVSLEIWETDLIKGYNLKIKGRDGVDIRSTKKFLDSTISIYHFGKFSNQNWIIIDSERDEKVKKLKKSKSIKIIDKSSFKKNPKYCFDNVIEISLTPQIIKDNFLLKIITETEVVELEVIQDVDNIGPKSGKRKILRQWKHFKKQELKLKKHNDRVRNSWEDAMVKYQKIMRKSYSDSVLKANNPKEFTEKQMASANYEKYKDNVINNFVNSGDFNFPNLGTCNIDRLMRELVARGKETFFESLDSNGEKLELESVSVLSTKLPRSVTYTGNMVYLFNKSKTIIIGKTTFGDLAYMNTTAVKNVKKNKDGKSLFQFEVVKPTEISLDDLQKLTLE